MAITPADIQAALLQGDDFGFEMRVGGALAEVAGAAPCGDPWHTTFVERPLHGGTYTDPITGKPRQFDYRCRVINHSPSLPAEEIGRAALLAIECKNLFADAPLVVSGTDRTRDEAYYCFVEAADGRDHVRTVRQSAVLYQEGSFVGKNLVRLKPNKNGKLEGEPNSDVYDKWSQAVSSSSDLVLDCIDLTTCFHRQRFIALVLAVVVVPDGTLWRVHYDKAGGIQRAPASVDECEYFIGRTMSPDFKLSHLHFVTVTGLKALIERFWKRRGTWQGLLPAQNPSQ